MPLARLSFLILCLLSLGLRLEASYLYVWEGFEREINWEADSESAASGRLVDSQYSSEGSHSLKLLIRSSSASARATFKHRGQMDWSPYGALLLDVYNPSDAPVKMGIVIGTGEDGDDQHEAFTAPLAPGWNRDVRIDLCAAIFATEANDHRPEAYLVNRGDVEKFKLNVYPGRVGDTSVNVDNIRLERAGMLVMGPATVDLTLEGIYSGPRLDYVPPDLRLRPSDLSAMEDFEDGSPSWDSYDPSAYTSSFSGDFTSQGSTALNVSFPASPDGFDVQLDSLAPRLAGTGQLRMDVYNPGQSVSAALKLEGPPYDGGGDPTVYSSGRVTLRHGWNTPIFDFTNSRAWSGGLLTPEVLASLSAVSLNVASRVPGRLYLDGISTSAIALNGASRTSGLLSFSYNPHPDFEIVADARAEDVFYGKDLSDSRDAGTEAYLNSVKGRYEAGFMHTGMVYRNLITGVDQPIMPLIQPGSLGTEIAAVEFSGRQEGTSFQGVLASRLEYNRYNSRMPSGFGPENAACFRLRQDISNALRVGVTFLNHQTSYGPGTAGIPQSRQTLGYDVDGHFDFGGPSLGLAAEAGGTASDMSPRSPLVPENDRFYYAISVSPSWGRLTLNYFHTVAGYDFDGDLGAGSNSVYHFLGGGLDLDGMPLTHILGAVPIYDRSLGKNLSLSWGMNYRTSRDKYKDPSSGVLLPLYESYEIEGTLENDSTAHPNLSLQAALEANEDPWTSNPVARESMSLRFPVAEGLSLSLDGSLQHDRSLDKESGQSGESYSESGGFNAEANFRFKLTVWAGGSLSHYRNNWEGVWQEGEQHFKFRAGASQSFGANSLVRLDYGQPALFGRDFGIQNTIDVYTLTVKTYF